MSKKNFKKLIDELVCDTCKSDYCFVKVFLESLHPEPIVLIQLKCIEKFKWEESERLKREVDWNEAIMIWAETGYAKAFRKVWNACKEKNEKKPVLEIYKLTMEEMAK
ncbi:MAG: hypothetical protein WC119_00635 [Synergistaceae bacterium]